MRFGVGGGSRVLRGGVSVGRGGARGGVGVGPFSVSGGSGGGGSSAGLGDLFIGFFQYVIVVGLLLLLAISAASVALIAAVTGATSHFFWLITYKTCEVSLRLRNTLAALVTAGFVGCAITSLPVLVATASPLSSPGYWDSRFGASQPGNQWPSVAAAAAVHVICWGTALTCIAVVFTALSRRQAITKGFYSGLEIQRVRQIASDARLQRTTLILIDGVPVRVLSSTVDRMRIQASLGDQVGLWVEKLKPILWAAIENVFPAIMIVKTNWSPQSSKSPVRKVGLPDVLEAARSVQSAGWYPDPSGICELRYWDGERWTKYASRWGQHKIDVKGLKRITHAEHEERRLANLKNKQDEESAKLLKPRR